MNKVALITGGASGLGLAVATSLAGKGWKVSIADMNVEAGKASVRSLGAKFYETNVTDYTSLSGTFQSTFNEFGHIDFVFANAGIVEKDSFYTEHSPLGPPPEINMLSVDIDLKGVIATGYLAQHYFRQNPNGSGGCLISTSSVGGIYQSYFTPIYSAAKHGVIGFTRSIAKHFYLRDKIRVNAILPGTMRTPLLTEEEWERFGDVEFTPISKVVEVVEMLLDEGNGLWGKTVEISGTRHYFREQLEYCDEDMKRVMEATDVLD